MTEKENTVFEDEQEYDNGFRPKEVVLPNNYVFYPRKWYRRLFNFIIIAFTAFITFFLKRVLWGYKVTGKKNFKKHPKGNVLVSNHVLQQDCFCIATLFWTKRLYITMLQSNLGFGIVSKYMRLGGGVPIPTNPKMFVRFCKETKNVIARGGNILVYPEAKLVPYCSHIRPFMPGAFHFAYQSNATIIPICITFHKPRGLYRLYKKKPCIHLNILEPYKITKLDNRQEGIKKIENDIHEIMTKYFNENNEISYKKYKPKLSKKDSKK